MNQAGSEPLSPLVLIVDDETVIRAGFRDFLEDYDYRVIEAEDGRKGIEAFHEHHPDLVISDLIMPEVNGLEILSEITEKSSDTPVIVISGTGYIKDVVAALRLGAWDYLVKPIEDLSILRHSIEKALERSRLLRENGQYQAHLESEVNRRTKALEKTNLKLQESEKKARKLAETLEKRVEERTNELLETNIALRKAKKEADAAANAKSHFVANMSHEIRNPLNGVIAAANLALQENVSPKLKDILNIIHRSGYVLLGIINDILDFSKIEAGKLELEIKPFHLEEVLDNVIILSINKINDKRIELLVDVETEMPGVFEGDPLRIQQILINLIDNAIKFSNKNSIISLNISKNKTAVQPGWTELAFSVRDSGLGMNEEQKQRLFSPFNQADTSTSRKYGGTGLGLSICKNLTQAMGGNIWAESRLNEGSTFHFTIPLKNGPENLEKPIEVPPPLKHLRVLVVDDCPETVKLLTKILKSFDFKTKTALSGSEAVQFLETGDAPFDLILIDRMMPGMDGPETVQYIQTHLKRNIPVIMMSAYGKELQVNKSKEIRISSFLSKPFYASSLLDAIMEIFSTGKPGTPRHPRPAPPSPASSPYQKYVQGMRLLLVEDNITNKEIARTLLENGGAFVETAGNGQEALEIVQNKQFDAVLMDIGMPVMDGYEATRRIRRHENRTHSIFNKNRAKHLPIIAMTAHAMKGDKEKCLDSGMDGYVTKPIDQEKLFQVLYEKVSSKFPRFAMRKTLHSSPYLKPGREKARGETPSLPDELPGIAVKDALKALQVNSQIYINVLNMFCQDNSHTIDKINNAFNKKAWDDLIKRAHKIKGAAANIRAYDVQESALALEMAAREALIDNSKAEPDRELIIRLEKALNRMIASVSELNKIGCQSYALPSPDLPEQADAILKAFYHTLKQATPWKVSKKLDTLSPHLKTTDRQALRGCVDSYNYGKAINEIRRIAKEMSIKLEP